jgi:hypothetical protein
LPLPRAAIELVLAGHKPYPAFALDRHWNIVASNGALPQIFEHVDPALLQAPINALRVSLHPRGIAPRILNLAEWRAHLLSRLTHQIEISADATLSELMTGLPDRSGQQCGYARRQRDHRPGAFAHPRRRIVALLNHPGVRFAARYHSE